MALPHSGFISFPLPIQLSPASVFLPPACSPSHPHLALFFLPLPSLFPGLQLVCDVERHVTSGQHPVRGVGFPVASLHWSASLAGFLPRPLRQAAAYGGIAAGKCKEGAGQGGRTVAVGSGGGGYS